MLQQAGLLQYSRESVHSSTLRIFVKMVRFGLAYFGFTVGDSSISET